MKKKKLLKSSKSSPARKSSGLRNPKRAVTSEDNLVTVAIGKVALNARKRAIYHKASYTIIKDGLIIKRMASGNETELGKVYKKKVKRIPKTFRIK